MLKIRLIVQLLVAGIHIISTIMKKELFKEKKGGFKFETTLFDKK
jgi:hypothetical protein